LSLVSAASVHELGLCVPLENNLLDLRLTFVKVAPSNPNELGLQ